MRIITRRQSTRLKSTSTPSRKVADPQHGDDREPSLSLNQAANADAKTPTPTDNEGERGRGRSRRRRSSCGNELDGISDERSIMLKVFAYLNEEESPGVNAWRRHGHERRRALLSCEDKPTLHSDTSSAAPSPNHSAMSVSVSSTANQNVNIQRYYAMADRVLSAFLSSYRKLPGTAANQEPNMERLDDAFVYGHRLLMLLLKTIPTHPMYRSELTEHKMLRMKAMVDVKYVHSTMKDIVALMDTKEFNMHRQQQMHTQQIQQQETSNPSTPDQQHHQPHHDQPIHKTTASTSLQRGRGRATKKTQERRRRRSLPGRITDSSSSFHRSNSDSHTRDSTPAAAESQKQQRETTLRRRSLSFSSEVHDTGDAAASPGSGLNRDVPIMSFTSAFNVVAPKPSPQRPPAVTTKDATNANAPDGWDALLTPATASLSFDDSENNGTTTTNTSTTMTAFSFEEYPSAPGGGVQGENEEAPDSPNPFFSFTPKTAAVLEWTEQRKTKHGGAGVGAAARERYTMASAPSSSRSLLSTGTEEDNYGWADAVASSFSFDDENIISRLSPREKLKLAQLPSTKSATSIEEQESVDEEKIRQVFGDFADSNKKKKKKRRKSKVKKASKSSQVSQSHANLNTNTNVNVNTNTNTNTNSNAVETASNNNGSKANDVPKKATAASSPKSTKTSAAPKDVVTTQPTTPQRKQTLANASPEKQEKHTKIKDSNIQSCSHSGISVTKRQPAPSANGVASGDKVKAAEQGGDNKENHGTQTPVELVDPPTLERLSQEKVWMGWEDKIEANKNYQSVHSSQGQSRVVDKDGGPGQRRKNRRASSIPPSLARLKMKANGGGADCQGHNSEEPKKPRSCRDLSTAMGAGGSSDWQERKNDGSREQYHDFQNQCYSTKQRYEFQNLKPPSQTNLGPSTSTSVPCTSQESTSGSEMASSESHLSQTMHKAAKSAQFKRLMEKWENRQHQQQEHLWKQSEQPSSSSLSETSAVDRTQSFPSRSDKKGASNRRMSTPKRPRGSGPARFIDYDDSRTSVSEGDCSLTSSGSACVDVAAMIRKRQNEKKKANATTPLALVGMVGSSGGPSEVVVSPPSDQFRTTEKKFEPLKNKRSSFTSPKINKANAADAAAGASQEAATDEGSSSSNPETTSDSLVLTKEINASIAAASKSFGGGYQSSGKRASPQESAGRRQWRINPTDVENGATTLPARRHSGTLVEYQGNLSEENDIWRRNPAVNYGMESGTVANMIHKFGGSASMSSCSRTAEESFSMDTYDNDMNFNKGGTGGESYVTQNPKSNNNLNNDSVRVMEVSVGGTECVQLAYHGDAGSKVAQRVATINENEAKENGNKPTKNDRQSNALSRFSPAVVANESSASGQSSTPSLKQRFSGKLKAVAASTSSSAAMGNSQHLFQRYQQYSDDSSIPSPSNASRGTMILRRGGDSLRRGANMAGGGRGTGLVRRASSSDLMPLKPSNGDSSASKGNQESSSGENFLRRVIRRTGSNDVVSENSSSTKGKSSNASSDLSPKQQRKARGMVRRSSSSDINRNDFGGKERGAPPTPTAPIDRRKKFGLVRRVSSTDFDITSGTPMMYELNSEDEGDRIMGRGRARGFQRRNQSQQDNGTKHRRRRSSSLSAPSSRRASHGSEFSSGTSDREFHPTGLSQNVGHQLDHDVLYENEFQRYQTQQDHQYEFHQSGASAFASYKVGGGVGNNYLRKVEI